MAATKDQDAGFQAVVVLSNSGRMYYRLTAPLTCSMPKARASSRRLFSRCQCCERKQRFPFPIKAHPAAAPKQAAARVDIGTGEIEEGGC